MGTRADFYTGRGPDAEWLGSIAWDGNPSGVFEGTQPRFGPEVRVDEADWRRWVGDYLAARNDGTFPDDGWPWPWDDSRTTDYAYALDGGLVYGSCFGREWFTIDLEADCYGEPELESASGKVAVFPDMSARKRVAMGGPRSGIIVLGF